MYVYFFLVYKKIGPDFLVLVFLFLDFSSYKDVLLDK